MGCRQASSRIAAGRTIATPAILSGRLQREPSYAIRLGLTTVGDAVEGATGPVARRGKLPQCHLFS